MKMYYFLDSSEATPNLSLSSNHSLVSLCGNSHSLMAAHDESTDDMQALFELAQTLITCPQEAEHQNLNVVNLMIDFKEESCYCRSYFDRNNG